MPGARHALPTLHRLDALHFNLAAVAVHVVLPHASPLSHLHGAAHWVSSPPPPPHLTTHTTPHSPLPQHVPTHAFATPQGIAFFVRALPAARAEAVRAAVEAAAAPLEPAPGDSDWETYHLFLECIDKRAAKVGRLPPALGGIAVCMPQFCLPSDCHWPALRRLCP